MEFLNIFRVIFGLIFVLFIPGLMYSFVFFPKKQIGILERFLISLIISIAFVPLFVFICTLIGINITTLSVFLEIFFLIMLGGIIFIFQNSNYIRQRVTKKS